MKVEVVAVVQKISFLGRMFELLVIVVDDTDPVGFTVSQVSGKITSYLEELQMPYNDGDWRG